jgi:hypothetical protein
MNSLKLVAGVLTVIFLLFRPHAELKSQPAMIEHWTDQIFDIPGWLNITTVRGCMS